MILAESKVVALWCRLILFLRIIILHRSAFSSTSKSGVSDQARIIVGLCALLQV